MDFKEFLEGARPFFQGLPQPLSHNAANSSETPTGAANAKEKTSNSGTESSIHSAYGHHGGNRLPRTGSNATVPFSGSSSLSGNDITGDGSMNINNNNNNKTEKEPCGSVGNKRSHQLNNHSPVPSNTSGKSGDSGGGSSNHTHLHSGFASSPSIRSSSNQSHVPIHVPLTLPLPNHHQVTIQKLINNACMCSKKF